jgi:Ni/Co efflux regulator RcnB
MIRPLMTLAAAALVAAPVAAQQATAAAQTPVAVDLSPRGQVETNVYVRGANNRNQAVGRLVINYGQPSARGRAVLGGLIPVGQVWRLGANAATSLRTDVDLTLGGTRIPKGEYTLFLLAKSPTQAELIVNKQTQQWGTSYDEKQDLVRIPVTVETLPQAVETFTMWLVPAAEGPRGDLRMAWGTVQYRIGWTLAR